MRGISLFVQWLRLYSQCRGPGFNPWSRNAKKPKKKKKKKERNLMTKILLETISWRNADVRMERTFLKW